MENLREARLRRLRELRRVEAAVQIQTIFRGYVAKIEAESEASRQLAVAANDQRGVKSNERLQDRLKVRRQRLLYKQIQQERAKLLANALTQQMMKGREKNQTSACRIV